MNSLRQNLSLSLALAALALTPFALPAYAQQANADPLLIATAAVPSASSAAASPSATPETTTAEGLDASWTGVYVGANIGYVSTRMGTTIYPYPNPTTFVNLAAETLHPDHGGAIGGASVGYNWEAQNHVLLGLEADISGSNAKGKIEQSPVIQANGTPFPGAASFVSAGEQLRWLSTVRPRLGYVTPHVMFYGTVGAAFGHANYAANTSYKPLGDETYPVTVGGTKVGWSGGFGAEFPVNEHITIKGEYLYYDLGTQYSLINPSIPNPPFQVGYNFETNGQIVRAGINFHF